MKWTERALRGAWFFIKRGRINIGCWSTSTSLIQPAGSYKPPCHPRDTAMTARYSALWPECDQPYLGTFENGRFLAQTPETQAVRKAHAHSVQNAIFKVEALLILSESGGMRSLLHMTIRSLPFSNWKFDCLYVNNSLPLDTKDHEIGRAHV